MYVRRMCQYFVFALLIGAVAIGCSSASPTFQQSNQAAMTLPDYVRNAPMDVQTAYQYAVTHPDELAKYPCYCGCGRMGHTSNKSCYIKDISATGQIAFDNHAVGCGICVDITKDVIRLKAEGKTSRAVRDYIDTKYSPFGPGTNTDLPTD
jgi:hypothetical protein